jgi:hypothetical protein
VQSDRVTVSVRPTPDNPPIRPEPARRGSGGIVGVDGVEADRRRGEAMPGDEMNGVHHVVWCVRPESFPRLREFWERSVGLTLEELDLPELGLKILISWKGGVEIMAPFYETGALADVARRFLAERGEGVYTVVVNVRGIDGLVASLVSQGASLLFRETIPPDAVLERKLSDGARFSILQAGFEKICGMPICLQEIVPE